jgi:hypothetical protein
MSESAERFNTVKEIFEKYIPNYKAHTQETLIGRQVNLGSQLASDLIEEFRTGVREGLKGAEQRNAPDA